MDLRCDIDNLRLLEPISGHKTRVNNTVNLYSYLRFCGNIMFTAGPNDNVWLTEATGRDTNDYNMLNDSNFALFWTMGGVVGPHGSKMKNWRFCSCGNFGDKNHRFHLPAKQCGGVSALQSPEIVYRCLAPEIRRLSTYQSPQVLRNIANL